MKTDRVLISLSVVSLSFAQYCVLGDALRNLAEHFQNADGMSEQEAKTLAHRALKIDEAEWRAVGIMHGRALREGTPVPDNDAWILLVAEEIARQKAAEARHKLLGVQAARGFS